MTHPINRATAPGAELIDCTDLSTVAVPVGGIVGVVLAVFVLAIVLVLVLLYVRSESRRKGDKIMRNYRYQIELVRSIDDMATSC